MNLTNRIKARLSDLENDLQEKKVSFLIFSIASDVYCSHKIFAKSPRPLREGHRTIFVSTYTFT